MIAVLFFLIGFYILLKGADFLVEGASSVARRFQIAPIVIGLTIVSFGTSAPEFIINILSSLNGNSEIAIGNIVGSNIANILLILGLSSTIYPLISKHNTVWKEIPLALLAVILLAVMGNDTRIDGATISHISRIDGIIFIAFFIVFMYYTVSISKATGEEKTLFAQKHLSFKKSSLYVLSGLLGLAIGGKFIVDGAVFIAATWGLSESLIGLTIIAIGTSLPELATSAVAAFKKNPDIAIGNVVGSNIFNVFFILGISALINPIPFKDGRDIDLIVATLASLALFAFMFIGKKHTIERHQGAIMLTSYIGYLIYLVAAR
jgi:cation:H+ antiporter